MPARRSRQHRELVGTARPGRGPQPDLAAKLTAVPNPPEFISAGAAVEWARLAPVAFGLGTLTVADLRAFALLAETLATATDAAAAVARDGYTTATADGGAKAHPCVRVLETARAQAARLLADFGLTPRGRQGVDVAPPPRGPSAYDEFLAPWDVPQEAPSDWDKLDKRPAPDPASGFASLRIMRDRED